MADSSKSSYSSLVPFAAWEEIDYLITDSNLPQDFKRKLEARTSVVCADD